jgi:hypothetical protein
MSFNQIPEAETQTAPDKVFSNNMLLPYCHYNAKVLISLMLKRLSSSGAQKHGGIYMLDTCEAMN